MFFINQFISYVYDIMVIFVIVHNVLECYKKGFVKSLFSIIFYIVGIVFSHFLGKILFRSSLGTYLFDEMENILFKQITNVSTKDNGNIFFKDIVGETIFKFFLKKIIFIILFCFIFSFFKNFKKYIFKFAKITRKMPVVGILDGFLGALCGLAKSTIILFLFSIVCFILIILTKNELFFLNDEVIKSTYLFYLFYKIIYFLR